MPPRARRNTVSQRLRQVLVLSFTDHKRDPRVNRQLRALRRHYRVVAAGTGDSEIEDVRFVRIQISPRTTLVKANEATQLLLKRYEQYYWGQRHVAELERTLGGDAPALIIANDIETLPLAIKVAKGAKVVFDAHEYSPREFEDRFAWRLIKQPYIDYLCHKYIGSAAAMMTVADGIAEEFGANFKVKPEVVLNAPKFHQLRASPVRVREFRMIHHGAAVPARKIETMLQIMRDLDGRFRLALMLIPTLPRYLESLKRRAADDERIRFLDPVPMSELVAFGNAYDIGLYLLQPSSFNNLHALPNKFFEFIQSRLMIAVGPSPEMASLVQKYDCGVVANDFRPASLAHALGRLDVKEVERYKGNTGRAAEELCFEQSSRKFLALVAKTLGEA